MPGTGEGVSRPVAPLAIPILAMNTGTWSEEVWGVDFIPCLARHAGHAIDSAGVSMTPPGNLPAPPVGPRATPGTSDVHPRYTDTLSLLGLP
jgi:hypothetical protein